MGRSHVGAVIGALAFGLMFSLGVTHCAAPTQIIVTVRADDALCYGSDSPLNQTGIAVTAPDKIDTDAIDIYQDQGCAVGGLEVGALTITPSGDDTAAVGIRIVAALGRRTADACNTPGTAGCIITKRTSRFVPGATNFVDVFLSAKCIDSQCGNRGLECDPNTGDCVTQIQEDGAVAEPDSGIPDSSPNFDANEDACVNCSKPGMSCLPDLGLCAVLCTGENPCGATIGGPVLDFKFTCKDPSSCSNLRCIAKKCEFDCTNAGGPATTVPLCNIVSCQAGECVMQCGQENACATIALDGGSNQISCAAVEGKPSCNNVHCGVTPDGTCARTCEGSGNVGCGAVTSCEPEGAPSCAQWGRLDAGDGGGND